MWTRLRLCSRAQQFIEQSHLESPEVQRSCEAMGRAGRSNNWTHPSMCVHSWKKWRGSWDAWRVQGAKPSFSMFTMSYRGHCLMEPRPNTVPLWQMQVRVPGLSLLLQPSEFSHPPGDRSERTLCLVCHRTPQMPWPGLETLKSLSLLCFW